MCGTNKTISYKIIMNSIIRNDLKQIISSPIINWECFKESIVLITGANGILPSYLVYTLLYLNETKNYNIKVIALVRDISKAETKFKDFLNDENLKFIVQDVCEEIFYSGNLDYIIHAASQASPKYYGIDPVGTINANIIGTINTLKLAKEKKVKSFLFFSSGEVYGNVSSDKCPIKETEYGYIDPIKVRSCYGESKRMGENLSVSWHYQYGINVKIVRPFHTYGPGLNFDDGRVFADFCKNIVNNEDIVLRSDGSALRPFCYITDAVIAYFKVLLDGKVGEAYNIGNPYCEISILQLAEILISLYPEKKLNLKKEILKDDMTTVKMKSPLSRSVPDISKVESLGWKPIISIEEGFSRTIESFLF